MEHETLVVPAFPRCLPDGNGRFTIKSQPDHAGITLFPMYRWRIPLQQTDVATEGVTRNGPSLSAVQQAVGGPGQPVDGRQGGFLVSSGRLEQRSPWNARSLPQLRSRGNINLYVHQLPYNAV